jgi:hypothetical protein
VRPNSVTRGSPTPRGSHPYPADLSKSLKTHLGDCITHNPWYYPGRHTRVDTGVTLVGMGLRSIRRSLMPSHIQVETDNRTQHKMH